MEQDTYERERITCMRWLVIDMKVKGRIENDDITEEFKKKVGEMIKNKRLGLNWTQDVLAEKLGTNVEGDMGRERMFDIQACTGECGTLTENLGHLHNPLFSYFDSQEFSQTSLICPA
jgi:hypothetical protein